MEDFMKKLVALLTGLLLALSINVFAEEVKPNEAKAPVKKEVHEKKESKHEKKEKKEHKEEKNEKETHEGKE